MRRALTQDTAQGQAAAEVVAATVFGPGGRKIGVLRVSEPRQESVRRITRAIWKLTALAGAVLGLAALAARWLVRRLLRPVEQLRQAAARLGQGDFTIDAPYTGLPELDQVAAALNNSRRRVGQLVERERAFSVDASHQMRTPLAAVTVAMETELLSPRADPGQVLRESLHALAGLERTVDELLLLARDTHSDREPVDATDLLARAHDRWQTPAAAAGRQLTIQEEANRTADRRARVSQAALDHILDVLIDNALLHGAGNIDLQAHHTPAGLVLTVSDRGACPAHPDELFQRRNPTAGGTGIGLSMARALAEAEGVRLNLAPAEMTRFELVVPTSAACAADQG